MTKNHFDFEVFHFWPGNVMANIANHLYLSKECKPLQSHVNCQLCSDAQSDQRLLKGLQPSQIELITLFPHVKFYFQFQKLQLVSLVLDIFYASWVQVLIFAFYALFLVFICVYSCAHISPPGGAEQYDKLFILALSQNRF